MPGQQARELLIYVGETADRLGFRVFNPRTYKFSTEFELFFDENSTAERGEAIRQWDLRRKLHAEGKLDSLPLIGNDLKDVRERDLDVERRIYQDQRYLKKEDDEKGDLHAPVVLKPEVFNNADSAPPRALGEKEAEAKFPNPLAEPLFELKDRENSNDATSSKDTRTGGGTSQLTARNSSIHPDQLSGSRVGDSNWAPQSDELATLRNAPLTWTRDSKGTVDGRPVDAYPHQARERWSEGLPKEGAGADQLARADQVGPLTPMVIEEERKLAQFDPRHPRRPLR